MRMLSSLESILSGAVPHNCFVGIVRRCVADSRFAVEGQWNSAGGKPKAPPPGRALETIPPRRGGRASSPLKPPAPFQGAIREDDYFRWRRLRLATG